MKKIPQDIVGNIAILKFPRGMFWIVKKIKAMVFLKKNKTVSTVVEKVGKISGELRLPTMRYLAGNRTYTAIYKENGCFFKFDINKSYFSPRLSNERKVVADEVVALIKKKSANILVMFAGIAPYPIIVAKKIKSAGKTATVFSNELNEDANFAAKENVCLNKLDDKIILISGDASKIPSKVKRMQSVEGHKKSMPSNFDIILMPRPNLKETFLKTALKLSKRGTTVFYHGFGTKEKVLGEIGRDCGARIGRIKIRKAGDIGPHEFRWQAVFRVK